MTNSEHWHGCATEGGGAGKAVGAGRARVKVARLGFPLFRRLPAESAHGLALLALQAGLAGADPAPDDPILACDCFGLPFANPIGLAAGFDKDARVADAILGLGFGAVEVGTLTPRPQPGNPRPRLFRLAADGAVINRMGFNSGGIAPAVARLGRMRRHAGVVGANIGANRDSRDRIRDYVTGFAAVHGIADYVTVNVSSPNTPGLRALQSATELARLLDALLECRAALGPKPILVKVAPDLEADEIASIAEVTMARRIDGLIVGNTTTGHREGLRDPHRGEAGGLSGRPLFAPSTAVLAAFHRHLRGRLALVGVGGVASGADAYAKIRAGAHLVQLYTALIYAGPWLVGRIKADLAALLRRDGFARVRDAVGTGAGQTFVCPGMAAKGDPNTGPEAPK